MSHDCREGCGFPAGGAVLRQSAGVCGVCHPVRGRGAHHMRHGSWMHHVAYVDSTLEIDGVLMVAAWVQHSRLRTRPSGGAGVRTARRARRPTRRGAGPTRPSCRAARSPRHAPRGPAAVIARASFGPVPVLRKVPDAVQGVPCRAVPGREVWFGSARESAPAPAAAHDRPVSTPGRSGSFATGMR